MAICIRKLYEVYLIDMDNTAEYIYYIATNRN